MDIHLYLYTEYLRNFLSNRKDVTPVCMEEYLDSEEYENDILALRVADLKELAYNHVPFEPCTCLVTLESGKRIVANYDGAIWTMDLPDGRSIPLDDSNFEEWTPLPSALE